MNRTVFVIVLFLLSILVYAREVPATNQGIANASPGDYIIRSSGEKVVLSQGDIDYARKQLGLTTTTNQSRPAASSTSNSASNYRSTSYDGGVILIIVIICIIHIILTYCVYKMKGGYFACFYFFFAPLALLFLLAGLKALSKVGKKRDDIHHYFH